MRTHYEKSLSMQDALVQSATELAGELRKPARLRDPEAIRAGWHAINRQRTKLNALHRALRKMERAPREQLSRKVYEQQRKRHEETQVLYKRLKIWDQMQDLVLRHVDAEATPLELYRDENDSDPMLRMLHLALHRLANPNPQSADADEDGCFPDIPLRIQLFEGLMLAAYRLLVAQGRAETARFIDVGCGGGTKVYAASRFFPFCDGLEYDLQYAEAGQRTLRLLKAENCTVIQGNGITFDRYEDYDVIYFYRPVQDDALLSEMEQQILNNARPGTVILAPYDLFLTPRQGFPAAQITGPVFITGISQDEADALHSEATRTTPDLVKRAKDFSFDTGFWAPLLNATRYNASV